MHWIRFATLTLPICALAAASGCHQQQPAADAKFPAQPIANALEPMTLVTSKPVTSIEFQASCGFVPFIVLNVMPQREGRVSSDPYVMTDKGLISAGWESRINTIDYLRWEQLVLQTQHLLAHTQTTPNDQVRFCALLWHGPDEYTSLHAGFQTVRELDEFIQSHSSVQRVWSESTWVGRGYWFNGLGSEEQGSGIQIEWKEDDWKLIGAFSDGLDSEPDTESEHHDYSLRLETFTWKPSWHENSWGKPFFPNHEYPQK